MTRGRFAACYLTLALAPVFGSAAVVFEVVSIKPTPPSELETKWAPEPGGRFSAQGATTRQLIALAYGVRESQVAGGPKWIGQDRWTIQAKAEGIAGRLSREQLLQGMKAMLGDRFRLRVRFRTREMPVYALVVSKGGPRLKAATEHSPFMHSSTGIVEGKSVTMDLLARTLSAALERPVIDRTGLAGEYEVRLLWAPDSSLAVEAAGTGSTAENDIALRGSIFTEIQSVLGLRLQARRGPAEVVEVAGVERPSEN